MQLSMLHNQRFKQHFKISKSSPNKKNVKHKDQTDTHTQTHTHTHTQKISLTNFIFQKQVKTVWRAYINTCIPCEGHYLERIEVHTIRLTSPYARLLIATHQ